eukprot:scaffold35612_cov60-Phaeocystis_antarctica.AAC.3
MDSIDHITSSHHRVQLTWTPVHVDRPHALKTFITHPNHTPDHTPQAPSEQILEAAPRVLRPHAHMQVPSPSRGRLGRCRLAAASGSLPVWPTKRTVVCTQLPRSQRERDGGRPHLPRSR